MKLSENVARMGEIENDTFYSETPGGRCHLKDLSIDGKIT
jgi:hypothetical protein